jgi:hypothetical protein
MPSNMCVKRFDDRTAKANLRHFSRSVPVDRHTVSRVGSVLDTRGPTAGRVLASDQKSSSALRRRGHIASDVVAQYALVTSLVGERDFRCCCRLHFAAEDLRAIRRRPTRPRGKSFCGQFLAPNFYFAVVPSLTANSWYIVKMIAPRVPLMNNLGISLPAFIPRRSKRSEPYVALRLRSGSFAGTLKLIVGSSPAPRYGLAHRHFGFGRRPRDPVWKKVFSRETVLQYHPLAFS